MRKLLSFMFAFAITLVCFDQGEKFCINPEYVIAVVSGDTAKSGTLIIMRDTNVIAGEKFDVVVKKIKDGQ